MSREDVHDGSDVTEDVRPILSSGASAAKATAAVMAGGLGSRLRAVVSDRPKVLATVCGRPFVQFVLDQICDAGIRRAVFCTGYLGDQVVAAIGSSYRDVIVSFSHEDTPLDTAGALKKASPMIAGDAVIVLNGDSYCDVDLGSVLREHRLRNFPGTLVVRHVEDSSRYGCVEFSDDCVITGFHEKRTERTPGWISAGVYCLKRELLEAIPSGRRVSLEREMFPSWVDLGLLAYPSSGGFVDIGTPEGYSRAPDVLGEARAHGAFSKE